MKKRSCGFTLIELLVALGLGVLLSFGLIQIFQNVTNLSRIETSLSRVQEVGRYAIDMLAKDLRMVGYHGCSDPNNMDVTVMASTGAANFSTTSLEGYEVAANGTFSPVLGASDDLLKVQQTTMTASVSARPGSDVVRVKFASRTGASLSGNTTANNAQVSVDSNPTGLSQGDLAIISDCRSAHIFRITNVTNGNGATINMAHAMGSGPTDTGGNDINKMEPGYPAGASLLTYQDLTYFVADTGRNTMQGDDVFALYRIRNGGGVEELLEGVEYLQLQYGEELASGNVRFVSANDINVPDMNNVKSLRLGLLVQGLEASIPQADSRTYSVAGTEIAASGLPAHSGGKYLRKPFMTTIKLRNKR